MCDPNGPHEGFCELDNNKYRYMDLSDQLEIYGIYHFYINWGVIIIVSLLILPQVVDIVLHRCNVAPNSNYKVLEETNDEEQMEMDDESTLESLNKQIHTLK